MPGKSANKLKDEHRAFLVNELACYATPKEAADALNAEYGVQLTPQGAEKYDPHKKAGNRLSKRWVELFERRRKEFLEKLEDNIPEANKAVRVKGLALAARSMRQRGNYVGMADMYERIAKEVGNVHTNRRELTGKDGKAMQFEDVTTMTPEQVDAELANHLKDPAMRTFLAELGLSAVAGSETKQ